LRITHSNGFNNDIILFFVFGASTGFLGAFTGIFKGHYKKKNPCGSIALLERKGKQNSFYYSTLGGIE
jgi:hypothetical protein